MLYDKHFTNIGIHNVNRTSVKQQLEHSETRDRAKIGNWDGPVMSHHCTLAYTWCHKNKFCGRNIHFPASQQSLSTSIWLIKRFADIRRQHTWLTITQQQCGSSPCYDGGSSLNTVTLMSGLFSYQISAQIINSSDSKAVNSSIWDFHRRDFKTQLGVVSVLLTNDAALLVC